MNHSIKRLLGFILLFALTVSCSGASPLQPTLAIHTPTKGGLVPTVVPSLVPTPIDLIPETTALSPTTAVVTVPFDQSLCPLDDSGRHVCPPESALGRLGCEWIDAPDADLSGLEPPYPINLCWSRGEGGQWSSDADYIYRRGCMLPQYARYVIERDGQFLLLASLAELQQTFAPISSKEEALSYALAATGLQAISNFEAPPNYRYFIGSVKDSQAIVTDRGYRVNLYEYQFCGCGPHTTFAVEVLINQDGTVLETDRTPAFEDPEQDTLCID